MATYIGEAAKDENDGIAGGSLGDQTGQEVRVVAWYAATRDGRRWDWIARIKNRPDVAKAMAILMIESCDNPNVGYDQSRRETFTNLCRAAGWKPKNVSQPCATDCSALVACILNCLDIRVSTSMTTRSELEQLTNTGLFDILYGAEYTTTGDNLQAGDIMHMSGHTAICVQNSTQSQPVAEEKKEEEQVGARMWITWSNHESGKSYNDPSGWYVMGGTGNGAYGRYQFHYKYGLVPMLQFCVEQYPTLFSGFQPYIDMGAGNEGLKNNENLHQLMKTYTEQHLAEFSRCQNWCMYNQYYLPLRQNILTHMGYDVSNIGAYAVGTVAALAIRNSSNWESNSSIFAGTTGKESENAWCKLVMSREISKSWVGEAEYSRWLSLQPTELDNDMAGGANVIQIGQGTATDSSESKAPINPSGDSAGSAGTEENPTPEIIAPTPDTPGGGGIEAGDTFSIFWILKYFANILPFPNI